MTPRQTAATPPRAPVPSSDSPTGRGVARVVRAGRAEPGGPIERTVAGLLGALADEGSIAVYATDLAEYLAWCTRHRPRIAPLRASRAELEAYGRRLDRRLVGEHPIAGATVRRKLAVVRAFYTRAIAARRHDGPNPVPRPPLRAPRPAEPPLGTGEAAALLAALAAGAVATDPRGALRARRDHLAVVLMLSLGLRSSAVLGLRPADVEPAAGEIEVDWTRGSRLIRAITPALGTLIGDWLAAVAASGIALAPGDPLLFGLDPAGRPSGGHPVPMARSTLYRAVHAALGDVGRHGRRSGPQALRRTSGALLFEATGDVHLLREHLGHASLATTLIYVGDRAASQARAIERLPLAAPVVAPRPD